MNAENGPHGSGDDEQAPGELVLAEFMQQNFERDPDWFVEPENSPDYGPPGMQTPFSPADPRIVDRQRNVSNSLRQLIDTTNIPENAHLDQYFFDMLQINYDSYNTILGVNNNDSYMRWKAQHDSGELSPELQHVMEQAVLGLANHQETLTLLQHTDDLHSAELFKLYHPFMYRMRHLHSRREETKVAVADCAGTLVDSAKPAHGNDPFYDLKLYPYTVSNERELDADEQHQIAMLQTSINKKLKSLRGYADEKGIENIFNGGSGDELIDAVSEQIDADRTQIQQIQDAAETIDVKGMMASIKLRIGTVPKNEQKEINITERQLFALDSRALAQFDMEKLRHIHARQEPDETALSVYEWVHEQFIANTNLIIPVSTTTYAYETDKQPHQRADINAALARLAQNRPV